MRQSYTRSAYRKGMPLWRHILLGFFVLCLCVMSAAAFIAFRGQPSDAIARGLAVLAPMPQPEPLYQLGDVEAEIIMPDVLDPADRAQTVAVITQDTPLAGTPAPERPKTAAPRVVTIDGRPVSEGETTVVGQRRPPPGRYIPQGQNSSAPLAPAPIAGLTRRGPFGNIPAPNAEGLTPLAAYAKPATPPRESRKMAIIVGGLGLNGPLTQRAIDELPPEVTLSFAPQTRGLQQWIDKARRKGHEVIIELPMEPYNMSPEHDIPGMMLKAGASPQDNVRTTVRVLSRAQGYFAVMNYYGEKFLDTPDAAAPAFATLKESGLGFIYNGVGRTGNVSGLAGQELPWAQNSRIIDTEASASVVSQSLTAMEATAGRREPALGVGLGTAYTIDGILFWAQGLEEREIALVPASFILLD